jgi:DNA (cytosine-5)-methyltransferase 1
MKHLDLFSGIGGFALAARWMNWETVQFVEIDKYCQKVLAKNFPNVPIHGDIKTFSGEPFRGTVDILTGGFPCQPFSHSGLRNGKDDDRYLWPQMLRVIKEVQPHYIVGENVSGLINGGGVGIRRGVY